MPAILRLADCRGDERLLVGGKAAQLALLCRLGFSVPAGVVITTEAHRSFLESGGLASRLGARVARIARAGDAATPEEIVRASRELRRMVEAHSIDTTLRTTLAKTIRALGHGPFAVRSSAIDEDGEARSWAGQLESFLYVAARDVPRLIRRCWSSAFSVRALAYRASLAADGVAAFPVAVIVQQMVPAKRAGVAFSADPVTGDPGTMIVEAVHGLGEAAVSGFVTPERHVLAKRSLCSVDHVSPRQHRMRVPSTARSGTRWVQVPASLRGRPVLRDAELRDLGRQLKRAECAFGRPVDLEWAARGKRIQVVQCRPITSISTSEATEIDLDAVEWRFVHTRRRSPFFKHCFFAPMSELSTDIGIDYRLCPAGIFLDAVVVEVDAWRRLAQRLSARWNQDPRWFLRTMANAVRSHRSVAARWKRLRTVRWTKESGPALANALERYVADLAEFAPHVGWVPVGEAEMTARVRDALLRRLGEEEGSRAFAIASDPIDEGSVMAERLALLRLAIQRHRGRDVRRALESHADRFSWMKNVGYLDDYYPLAHYERELEQLVNGDPEWQLTALLRRQKEKHASYRRLLRVLADDPLVVLAVRTANTAVAFRSWRTEIFYQSHVYVRHLLAEIGARLGGSATDVLYLFPDELHRLLLTGGRIPTQLAAARRDGYIWVSLPGGRYVTFAGDEARARRPEILPEVERSSPTGDALCGEPAFSGQARGRAVIVRGSADLDRVQTGDILVTPATNIDFVPALKRAVALVSEEGGILCHAAVVSREMQIPAVIGVAHATRRLATGDLIEVDATRGLVRRVAPSAVAPH